MILFRQADVYSPKYLGVKDVLVCQGRIEAVGDKLEGGSGCREIDARGYFLAPGLIDQHQHIIGGGGEGSFHTRTPQVSLSSLVRAGITTVLGLLGTDDVTRSVEDLVAKAKGLKEEGITAFALCGAYGYPSPTITGSVKKDIVFVDEILGVKLALSDHRAPNISTGELIRLASDVRTAGMIGGKAGIMVLHMGDGERRLDQVFEALEQTDIPIRTFHPTHMSRTPGLLQEGFRFAKMGGYIDITCESWDRGGGNRGAGESEDAGDASNAGERKRGPGKIISILEEARSRDVPMDRITFSSDGQGSWSRYDGYGRLMEIGVTDVNNMLCQLQNMVTQGNMDLSEALPFFTSNVAKALELYPRKGCIAPGADGDLLLIRPDMSLDMVLAGGAVMMEQGIVVRRGTYDKAEM